MRIREFGATVLAAGVILAGTAHAATDPAVTALQHKIVARVKAPCDLPASRALISDPMFAKIGGPMRSLALASLAYCGDPDAKSIVRSATSQEEAMPPAWRIRFLLALRADDREEALQTMEEAANRKLVNAFSTTPDEAIFRFSETLKNDPANERRFLFALDQLMWSPSSHFVTVDGYWIRLTEIHLAEGRLDDAKRVWQKAETPYAISRFRLANSYLPLREGTARTLDPVEAARQSLALDQFYLSQSPRDGVGLITVSQDLRRLGRSEEALRLLDDALANPGPLLKGSVEIRNWVLNEESSALYELGRFDEALKVLREASVLPEQGGPNVSQVINLAGLLNKLGRPAEALKALEILNNSDFINPSGRMSVESRMACANYALGNGVEAIKNLAFTAAHANDNHGAHLQALLCSGDLDMVAAEYVTRLEDPAQSPEILIELSQFRHMARGPGEIELSRRMDLLRGRADVQAAIAKVGHIESFDLMDLAMANTGY